MSKPAALALAGLALGFAFGFLWGRGTRDALSGNTATEWQGGTLVVRVNAQQAATEGLLSFLR